jgi:DNA-directed RNA polymerase subunit RPC12/RpoP
MATTRAAKDGRRALCPHCSHEIARIDTEGGLRWKARGFRPSTRGDATLWEIGSRDALKRWREHRVTTLPNGFEHLGGLVEVGTRAKCPTCGFVIVVERPAPPGEIVDDA